MRMTQMISEAGDNGSLDLDDVVTAIPPAVKTYQCQRSLPCYGRGKRLRDLQLPELPQFLKDEKEINKNTESGVPAGRGRGRRRKPGRDKDGSDLENLSQSPSGLRDLANSMSERCSVSSHGSSQGSDRCNGTGTPSQHSENLNEPNRVNPPHRDIESWFDQRQQSFSSPSKHNKNNTSMSSTPVKPVGDSDNAVIESPPLKDANGWSVVPPRVCQLDGIPPDLDLKFFHELLSSYGTIVDYEERLIDDAVCLRVKMNESDVCDNIEANMDKSDFTGTGSVVRCKHLRR